jgi:hypothetical protein
VGQRTSRDGEPHRERARSSVDGTLLAGAGRRAIRDPELPAAEVLLTPGRSEDLQPAVASSGVELRATTPQWVLYDPGERMTVVYEAIVERRDGRSGKARLVAIADREPPPPDVQTVEIAGMPVAVWRYPRDPFLPGLAKAASKREVRALLDDLGWPAGDVELRPASYSPVSHAVIEASVRVGADRVVFRPGAGVTDLGPERKSIYIKVMDPAEARHVHGLYERLSHVVSAAPIVHADLDAGLLAFGEVPGTPLGDWLTSGAAQRPSPAELVGVLDRIAGLPVDGAPGGTLIDQAGVNAALLRAIVPGAASRIDRVVDAIGEGDPQPVTTVHGDFHESQVMVDRGTVSGVLDLDDVGPGEHADDLALMAGRLWTLARTSSRRDPDLDAYVDALLADFGQRVPEAELRRRIGAAVLGRATGPFRNQFDDWPEAVIRRIELAEEWAGEQLR